jgi:hypothetical protein
MPFFNSWDPCKGRLQLTVFWQYSCSFCSAKRPAPAGRFQSLVPSSGGDQETAVIQLFIMRIPWGSREGLVDYLVLFIFKLGWRILVIIIITYLLWYLFHPRNKLWHFMALFQKKLLTIHKNRKRSQWNQIINFKYQHKHINYQINLIHEKH